MNVLNENNTKDLSGPIILEAIVGSRAYGMDHADSDTDTIGIWVAPIDELLGVHGLTDKASTRVESNVDSVYHEVGKFCRLALKCNPTLLEIMWIPRKDLIVTSRANEWLRQNRKAFLSTKMVRAAYGGYAMQQADRLAKRPDHQRYSKHARHLGRLLIQGQQLLQTGAMTVKLTPNQRDQVFALGELPPDELMKEFHAGLAQLDSVDSVLPDAPDEDTINTVLLNIRWEHAQ